MDFFDDILGRIIPVFIIFIMFTNILNVIFGRKKPMPEDEEPVEYDSEGNPVEQEDEEEWPEEVLEPKPETTQDERDRAVVEELERLLKMPKPTAPVPDDPELRSTLPPPKKEQKVIRDEDVKVYREKPLIEEEIPDPVVRTAERVVKRKKPVHPEMVKAIRWMEILGKPKSM